jgi:hypothetical protein
MDTYFPGLPTAITPVQLRHGDFPENLINWGLASISSVFLLGQSAAAQKNSDFDTIRQRNHR